MLELLNIRFSFLCRTTHTDPNGQHPVILRIIFRNERRDVFTGIYCDKNEWDSSVGRLFPTDKKSKSVNQNIDHIFRKANDAFDGLRFKGELFSIDELIDKIKDAKLHRLY